MPKRKKQPFILPVYRLKAAIFDMDGVVTETAVVHAIAWKHMFDAYLEARGKRLGVTYKPFDPKKDYYHYVDGKPRYDGVKSFLDSRGITLPWGNPEDSPEVETICGLGNRKNQLYLAALKDYGVNVYASTIERIQALRAMGIKTAVISASKNCTLILNTANIRHLFDTKVDGNDAVRLSLPGKPAPDVFLQAAQQLQVSPREAVVFEDALSGVQAARSGQFSLVIGVDRGNQSDLLMHHGADVVVKDLEEVIIPKEAMQTARPTGLHAAYQGSDWLLVYTNFEPKSEGIRESLCALGNGYFVTRGAAFESVADNVHYPGTYLAGGYNRLKSQINGHVVENEDLVNLSNWLYLTFRIEDGAWFSLENVIIHDYRQELDLKKGMLHRTIQFQDRHGRQTKLKSRCFVSMSQPHLAGLEVSLTPCNWSGNIEVRTALDGRVRNTNVKRYQGLNNQHLEPLETDILYNEAVLLAMQTNQSKMRVAQATRTRVFQNGHQSFSPQEVIREPDFVAQCYTLNVSQEVPTTVEKIVLLYTAKDQAISEPLTEAREALQHIPGFNQLVLDHTKAWRMLWQHFDIGLHVQAIATYYHPLLILRLHIFHLLQTLSWHTVDMDVGVPARGWHGEAYRGHVFWDELFIFPFLNFRRPDISRALLLYRYRRLAKARQRAAAAGYQGAMYPWQSGSNGREETPELSLSPKGTRWVPEHTDLQLHVNSAIAYNIWQYYQTTDDMSFLAFYGAEMLLEIARFWSSIATYNPDRDCYEIRNVMGPDEYHYRYPHAETLGIHNNAYTNLMAVWTLRCARKVLQILPHERCHELKELLSLHQEEIAHWDEISRKMRIMIDKNGIIQQFEGYEQLPELDWAYYRQKYGDIQNLAKILEMEGHGEPNDYKASKQADVLMLFYLFSSEELQGLFDHLGYPFEYETIPKNIEYYLQRTSHGSTLSRIVHSWVLARADRPKSWALFEEALESDVSDIQGGTTAEGIHMGAMAGTVDIVQRCYTGIVTRDDVLWLNPDLPDVMTRLHLRIRYRRQPVDLDFKPDFIRVSVGQSTEEHIQIGIEGQVYRFGPGESREFQLRAKPRKEHLMDIVASPLQA